MEIAREPQIDSQESPKALTLKEYSILHRVTEEGVWEMIEEGQLSARFVNDTILIYRESETPAESSPRLDIDFDTPDYLMSELVAEPPRRDFQTIPHLDLQPPRQPLHANEGPSHELDEGPNELLLFAQDSIARTVELSQQLLATKDELLRLKDEKLGFLERSLQDKDLEIRRLKRELENMQILQKISQDPQLLRPLMGTDSEA